MTEQMEEAREATKDVRHPQWGSEGFAEVPKFTAKDMRRIWEASRYHYRSDRQPLNFTEWMEAEHGKDAFSNEPTLGENVKGLVEALEAYADPGYWGTFPNPKGYDIATEALRKYRGEG